MTEMMNFKEQVLNFKTKIFSQTSLPDIRHLGIHILTKVIPTMDNDNDFAFAWFWKRSDVSVYTKKEYDAETGMYKSKHKLKKVDGDTTWFYDFKKNGKMRRCILTTEIWYADGKDFNTSPIAYLFNQFTSEGLHITKCKFEDI